MFRRLGEFYRGNLMKQHRNKDGELKRTDGWTMTLTLKKEWKTKSYTQKFSSSLGAHKSAF